MPDTGLFPISPVPIPHAIAPDMVMQALQSSMQGPSRKKAPAGPSKGCAVAGVGEREEGQNLAIQDPCPYRQYPAGRLA